MLPYITYAQLLNEILLELSTRERKLNSVKRFMI